MDPVRLRLLQDFTEAISENLRKHQDRYKALNAKTDEKLKETSIGRAKAALLFKKVAERKITSLSKLLGHFESKLAEEKAKPAKKFKFRKYEEESEFKPISKHLEEIREEFEVPDDIYEDFTAKAPKMSKEMESKREVLYKLLEDRRKKALIREVEAALAGRAQRGKKFVPPPKGPSMIEFSSLV